MIWGNFWDPGRRSCIRATTADVRAAHEDNIGQARNQVNICSTCLLRDRSRLDKSNNKGGTTDQRRRLLASAMVSKDVWDALKQYVQEPLDASVEQMTENIVACSILPQETNRK